jgi:hypothetical protein
MSKNRHTDSKRFMKGRSTGVYRGAMKHGAAVERFKDALHTEQPRTPVVRHDDCPSVGTDGATLAQVSAKGATDFTGRN